MEEESQFHITVVSQKRVRKEDASRSSRSERSRHSAYRETSQTGADPLKSNTEPTEAAAFETAKAESAERQQTNRSKSDHGGRSGSRQRSSHRRHYLDYGTVDLGTLDGAVEEGKDFPENPNGPVPTQGELQQQFYRKYDTILNRRYQTRNRNKITRLVLIVLVAALAVVIAFFGISSISGNSEETLEKPIVSTIPIETIDLG